MAWTEQDYQEIVARLMAESIGVNEVPDAESTDDISSLPAYQPANGTEVPTVVKASLELLVAPALEAADKANEAADKAESNATAAQTAANTANEKAELAAQAASDVNAAKEGAETAAQSANTAASNANEKAVLADTAAPMPTTPRNILPISDKTTMSTNGTRPPKHTTKQTSTPKAMLSLSRRYMLQLLTWKLIRAIRILQKVILYW